MAAGGSGRVPDEGLDYLITQDGYFARNAWILRWIGWITGFGTAVLAAFAGVAPRLYPNELKVSAWTGLIAAALAGINQVVKPEAWADAYYRGHLTLEMAIGDYKLRRATGEDLSNAWRQAQGGLPGAGLPRSKSSKP